MLCSVPSFDQMLERREQERKQQRKWDIEHGIARGIEEWKVSVKGCVDEKRSSLH